MRGRFITFEGGEGAGKSTQIVRLASYLSGRGIDALMTREPGGCAAAEDIRTMLVTGDGARWDPLSEALLHYTARREHLLRTVAPALEEGKWVLCDRFSDSTLAYQGYGHGLGADRIRQIDSLVLGDLASYLVRPDLTLILDLPVDAGLERAMRRAGGETRYEGLARDFHEKVRQGFLAIAAAAPDRCVVIDARGAPDEVAVLIREAVARRLGEAPS